VSLAVSLTAPPIATDGDAVVAMEGDALLTVTVELGSLQAPVAELLPASPVYSVVQR